MQSAESFLRTLEPGERGRVISVLRSAQGLTRDELAKAAKASPNTISDWEAGKVRNPRDLFAKLEGVLGLSLPNIQQAVALVRTQQRVREGGGAPPGDPSSVPSAVDEAGPQPTADAQEMTAGTIEEEIAQLYGRIGRIETRIHLLNLELAVRHGVLRAVARPAG